MIDQRELDIIQLEAQIYLEQLLKEFQEMMQGERKVAMGEEDGEIYGQTG